MAAPLPSDDVALGPASEPAPRTGQPALPVEADGFEGPLDLLLGLARRQKADAQRLSIRALAEHYLEVVEESRRFRLELAADALVMTASLACIRSRLLEPDLATADDPTAQDLAEALALRLHRLEAVLEVAGRCTFETAPSLEGTPPPTGA